MINGKLFSANIFKFMYDFCLVIKFYLTCRECCAISFAVLLKYLLIMSSVLWVLLYRWGDYWRKSWRERSSRITKNVKLMLFFFLFHHLVTFSLRLWFEESMLFNNYSLGSEIQALSFKEILVIQPELDNGCVGWQGSKLVFVVSISEVSPQSHLTFSY